MLNLAQQKDHIKELANKYGTVVPRYTSYPTAPEWKHEHSQEKFEAAIKKSNQTGKDYSLYLHLPFCESQCYFCGCNVIISPKHGIENPYITRLKEELDYYSKLIDKDRKVIQMAWGGGTPTYLTAEQIKDLYAFIEERFTLIKESNFGQNEIITSPSAPHDDKHEYAIEIDPRFTSAEQIQALWDCGFNRLSMGIQDFNPETQTAINRIQSFASVEHLVNIAREIGFTSINFDLIYGLPHQTVESFSQTIEQVIKINPDRIALFHYAHIPSIFAHQKKYIDENVLPSEDQKVRIFDEAVEKLTSNAYEFIGLDHFAKPDDSLSIAQKNRTLYRNFQGYTTHSGSDLFGFGVSSISDVQGVYKQNDKKINEYYQDFRITEKFMVCTDDDIARREIIKQIMCNGLVEIDSKKYQREIALLEIFVDDKVISLESNQDKTILRLQLIGLGRFFSRNIAAIFDSYLYKTDAHKVFSKTI